MQITMYKCTLCQSERADRDDLLAYYEQVKGKSQVKPNHVRVNDICASCRHKGIIKQQYQASASQDLESLRAEYPKATPERKKEIQELANKIKADANLSKAVVDHLL